MTGILNTECCKYSFSTVHLFWRSEAAVTLIPPFTMPILDLPSLITSGLQSEADAFAIARLMDLADAVDRLDERASAERLMQLRTQPPPNLRFCWRLWKDACGQLIGVGSVRVRTVAEVQEGHLLSKVHPEYRWIGLESEILDWAEAQMLQLGQEAQQPASLRVDCRDIQQQLFWFLQSRGFQASRAFNRMQRSLIEPLPEPQFPAGFTVRSLAGEADVAPWVELRNETFVNHWNFQPATAADYQVRLAHPDYRADLDWVLLEPTGMMVGWCECAIYQERNTRSGQKDGYIQNLGIRRGFRQRGLGRALLLAGLRSLHQKGMETALLDVDAENPCGAVHLYESVGFERSYTRFALCKMLEW